MSKKIDSHISTEDILICTAILSEYKLAGLGDGSDNEGSSSHSSFWKERIELLLLTILQSDVFVSEANSIICDCIHSSVDMLLSVSDSLRILSIDPDLQAELCKHQLWDFNLAQRLYKVYDTRYPIPVAQPGRKMYALLAYNTQCGKNKRKYAGKEFVKLHHALTESGFTEPLVVVDWTVKKFKSTLTQCGRIKKDCSLFFLAVMSHGSEGVIRDFNNNPLYIENDILRLLSSDPDNDSGAVSLLTPKVCHLLVHLHVN